MSQGVWPAVLAPVAGAIINGDTGAVIAKAGAGIGVFSKVGTGHYRVTLTGSGTESADGVSVALAVSAGSARIANYDIDPDVTPQRLDVFTWDAAGVAADAERVSLTIYRLSTAAPVPPPP